MKLHQIVRMEALSFTPDQIATSLGITVGTLGELTKHPEYDQVRDKYLEKQYGPIDGVIQERKASTILDQAAPDAAEVLADLLHSSDEVTQRISATAILDRTGHGPIQRRASRVRHEIDPVTAELLKTALKESSHAGEVIDVEVDDA